MTSLDKGILNISQCRVVITLIPKKGKNIKNILNWRPISLLNVDYKILTKILATRIKGVLRTIIHPDQKGFVPDRYIGENIIEIISTIDKLETEDHPGLLVSIDFYKAFDTLEWTFIKKAFEYFNFPEYLIKWVSVIYKNINSPHNQQWTYVRRVYSIKRGQTGVPIVPMYFCHYSRTISNSC